MASNSFGKIFRITTWGEPHGKAIGVVIDGCPAGLEIQLEELQASLVLRAPGRNSLVSPRKEPDQAEVLSGVLEGITTGAPISILITNQDADSSQYEPIKDLLRPGHANYTYLKKYGIFDYRGGGRASARETACRVVASVFAKKILARSGTSVCAYLKQIQDIVAKPDLEKDTLLHSLTYSSSIFCPDPIAASAMSALIEKVKEEGDSLGGIVEFVVHSAPVGLGDPVYEKLEANLAYALMGLPATKGFEMGSGFEAVHMRGSEHNDLFTLQPGDVQRNVHTETNHAGGTLGGISTGMPIIGRVVFKPTSSVRKPQKTLNTSGEEASFQLPTGSRHDPCVAIRGVPVVEAMVAIVLADAALLHQCTL